MSDANLRKRAESFLINNRDVMPPDTHDSLAKVIEELQIYQTELSLQNDDLRSTQTRLSQLGHRYKELFDRVPTPCMILDPEGVVCEANWAMESLLDRPRKTLIDRPFMLFVPTQWQAEVTRQRLSVLQSTEPRQFEIDLKGPGGKKLHVRMECSPFEEDETVYCLTTITDLTVIRDTEAAQQQAHKVAQELLTKQEDFLANVNHELRTPLTGILTAIELLLETPLSGEQQDLLQIMRRSGNHLQFLVEDLLKMQQIKKLGVEKSMKLLKLEQIIDDLFMAYRGAAEEKGLTLEEKIAADLPESIFAPAELIRQVLSNLIGNAVKYTDNGGITVMVRFGAPDQLLIDVVDTGIGMTPEFQTKAFDRFSQADTSEGRSYGGIGLGLSICRELLKGVGGTIQVSSYLGQGSNFQVQLPVMTKAENKRSTQGQDAHQAKVLLVEDNVETAKLITLILKNLGVSVLHAMDGPSAIQMFCKTIPELVLLDLQLPGMSGYETLAAMKECMDAEDQTRFWAVSGHLNATMAPKALEAGFDHYIEKPFVIDVFRTSVQTLLKLPTKEGAN